MTQPLEDSPSIRPSLLIFQRYCEFQNAASKVRWDGIIQEGRLNKIKRDFERPGIVVEGMLKVMLQAIFVKKHS